MWCWLLKLSDWLMSAAVFPKMTNGTFPNQTDLTPGWLSGAVMMLPWNQSVAPFVSQFEPISSVCVCERV